MTQLEDDCNTDPSNRRNWPSPFLFHDLSAFSLLRYRVVGLSRSAAQHHLNFRVAQIVLAGRGIGVVHHWMRLRSGTQRNSRPPQRGRLLGSNLISGVVSGCET